MKRLLCLISILACCACKSNNVKQDSDAAQNVHEEIKKDSIREAPDHSYDKKKLEEIKSEKAKLKKKRLNRN